MTPALGTLNPETRHLNLKWTVADTDKVITAAKNGHCVESIASNIRFWESVEASEHEIIAICNAHGVFVRTTGRRAAR